MENRTPKETDEETEETKNTFLSNTSSTANTARASSSNNKSLLLDLLSEVVSYKKVNTTKTNAKSSLKNTEKSEKPSTATTTSTVTSGNTSILVSQSQMETTLNTQLSTSDASMNTSGLIKEIHLGATHEIPPPTPTKTVNTEIEIVNADVVQFPEKYEDALNAIENIKSYSIPVDPFSSSSEIEGESETSTATSTEVSPSSDKQNRPVSQTNENLATYNLTYENTPTKKHVPFDAKLYEPSCSKTGLDNTHQAFPSRYFRSDKVEFRIKEFEAYESDRFHDIPRIRESTPPCEDVSEMRNPVYEKLRIQNWIDKMPKKQNEAIEQDKSNQNLPSSSMETNINAVFETDISANDADLYFEVPKKQIKVDYEDHNKPSTSKGTQRDVKDPMENSNIRVKPLHQLTETADNLKLEPPKTELDIILEKVSKLGSMLDLFYDRIDDASLKEVIAMLFMDIITSKYRDSISTEDTFKVLRLLSCAKCSKRYDCVKGIRSATVEAINSLPSIPPGMWVEHLMLLIRGMPESPYYQEVILQLLQVFLSIRQQEPEDVHIINLLIGLTEVYYDASIGQEVKDIVVWCVAAIYKRLGHSKFQDFLDYVPLEIMPHVVFQSETLK